METQTLSDCLKLQLDEVEMLCSMYPEKKEFFVTDSSVIYDMRDFLNGKATTILPGQLQYSFCIDFPEYNDKLDVTVNLPHSYPTLKPSVHARFSSADRYQQKELNSALSDFVNDQDAGELCVGSIFSWLADNAGKFCLLNVSKKQRVASLNLEKPFNEYSRIWVYSHHIYNKDKRRNIVDLGKNYQFTGFCMPGKPGIICAEGYASDCTSFFQDVKQMSWKKLSLLREDCFKLTDEGATKWRKFETFQEVVFQVRQGPAKEYHMDMREFQKYLESHNCSSIFHDIFGLKGSADASNN